MVGWLVPVYDVFDGEKRRPVRKAVVLKKRASVPDGAEMLVEGGFGMMTLVMFPAFLQFS